jgi:hypothetical protein
LPGRCLIGDQTQSNLLRVSCRKSSATRRLGDVEQGSVMPFFEGLESGVMRRCSSRWQLLLGQTGRGWQAKGGKVASLQHVRWDGKDRRRADRRDARDCRRLQDRFHPAAGQWRQAPSCLQSAVALESWTYRDASDYGSPELSLRDERFTSSLSATGSPCTSSLATLEQPQVHPHQTARVYHREDCLADAVRCRGAGESRCLLHAAALPRRRKTGR